MSERDQERRIEIGQTYFFEEAGENGLLGEVTTATISEKNRKLHICVTTEDGQGQILSRDVTNDELASYKAHPDAYFGVIQEAPRELKDAYELFEWMVDCYKKTPRERLLELSKDHPDADALASLDHLDLLLELCERWTASHQAGGTRSGRE